MPLLALNTVLPQSMRVKYQLLVGALPVSCMLASLLLPWAMASWLDRQVGVPLDAAIREQPGVLPWLAVFLLAMLLLMLLGYALGWVFNALVSRHVLGWSREQVRAVYLRSEVPAHWLKPDAGDAGGADARSIAKWAAQRQAGPWRFIALRGVLAWGAPMFAAMYLLPALLKGQAITPEGVLLYGALWATGGLTFGAFIWFASESNYRQLLARRPG